MSRQRITIFPHIIVIAVMLLSGCGGQGNGTPLATPGSPIPDDTATPAPARKLTVCLGQEPSSLYPFGSVTTAASSILAAIYDGPIDHTAYGFQAVILTKLPSLNDGDAEIVQVSVFVGDEVVGADGLPVTLAPDVRIRPAGCRDGSCAITYDGTAEVLMDQMIVNFSLLPGLLWSDGTPLTAQDSVYSYLLASDPATPGSKYLEERTKSYDATDDLTVQWWGKPGYIDPTYFTNFWRPYPRHIWGLFPADQLVDADVSAHMPIGWGAYTIRDWDAGEKITLVRNPNYFRQGEGLPVFDTLVFRFTSDPGMAVSELLSGGCDILDPGIRLDGQVELLRSLEAEGKLSILSSTTPIMEQLTFGIKPASYDASYTPGVDRADFFLDKRMRQAVALCLDRQKVVDEVLFGLTSVPSSYLPAEHPLYNPDAHAYAYDPVAANALLDSLGWKDVDNDPATPRQAVGVTGVQGGTLLELTYVTTGAAQRQQVAGILSGSLAQCGIRANVVYLDAETLFAQGPDGMLFGRAFDLVEFAMGTTGMESSCAWFSSAEVPAPVNRWIGVNISGYSSPSFDAACLAAEGSLPDEIGHAVAYQDAQSIFAEDLPSIPLYWRLRVAAARPDMCNFQPDPTASSALWNLESIDYGENCSP